MQLGVSREAGVRSLKTGTHAQGAEWGSVGCSRALKAAGIRGLNRAVSVGMRNWEVGRVHESNPPLVSLNNVEGK